MHVGCIGRIRWSYLLDRCTPLIARQAICRREIGDNPQTTQLNLESKCRNDINRHRHQISWNGMTAFWRVKQTAWSYHLNSWNSSNEITKHNLQTICFDVFKQRWKNFSISRMWESFIMFASKALKCYLMVKEVLSGVFARTSVLPWAW